MSERAVLSDKSDVVWLVRCLPLVSKIDPHSYRPFHPLTCHPLTTSVKRSLIWIEGVMG